MPAWLLAVIVGGCLLGPWLLPGIPDPDIQDLSRAREGLGAPGHLLGLDELGRDVLSRSLHGGRISLVIGVSAVVIGLVVGGALGVVAGYLGGWVDSVISRCVDVLLAFPPLVLQLTIATYMGPTVRNVIIALALYTVPTYARLARAGALGLRQRNHVLAARLAGAPPWHVMARHIVPNVMNSLIAYSLLALSTTIILAAALSFLGLGVPPPQASWGTMISSGSGLLDTAPHISLVPGVFLFLTVVALNMLNDRLSSRRRHLEGEV